MDEETTLNPALSGTDSGESENTNSARTGERRSDPLIPIPASKWREAQDWKRELNDLRGENRTQTLPTQPSKSTLTPEAEAALDQIADRTAGRFKSELSSVQEELDDLAIERGFARIMDDDATQPYRKDMFEELKNLRRANPKARVSELIDQAEERAIVKAWRSGKLSQAMAEEAHEQLQTKTRVSGQSQSATTTGRGKSERSLDEMGPEELAANPEKFKEYYEKTQGRAPRGK